jgi:hypothetical protein
MAKKGYHIHADRLELFEKYFNQTFNGIPENSERLKDSILADISKKNQVLIELKVLERTGTSNAKVKDPKELYRSTYAQEAIKQETKEYIEYLEYRLSQITPVKSTHYRELKERFFIMNELGFFDTPKWRDIANEKDKNKLLAEILQCDVDNAKKIRANNPIEKYKLTPEEKLDIQDMINEMKKRGL